MPSRRRRKGRQNRLLIRIAAAAQTDHAPVVELQAEGVAITMPLTAEEWGERAFQVRDPNGVIVQLVDWQAEPAAT